MASWDEYVDALEKTGKVGHVWMGQLERAPNGQPVLVTWAASHEFAVTPQEVDTIVKSLADEDEARMWPKKGVTINQVRYSYLRHEPNESVMGKTGVAHVCAFLTTKGVIIARSQTPVSFQDMVEEIGKTADYLKSMMM